MIVLAYHMVWYIPNTCVVACGWIGVGHNRETDEEHDEDCVEDGFQLASVKFDRDGEGGREALDIGTRSVTI